jgi:hypothetical protein
MLIAARATPVLKELVVYFIIERLYKQMAARQAERRLQFGRTFHILCAASIRPPFEHLWTIQELALPQPRQH